VIDDIVTDRLVLRPLTLDEARAIDSGERRDSWAARYPTAGDREIAAFLLTSSAYQPETLGVRQIVDRESGLVMGGVGFYGGPDPDGRINVGYGIAEDFRRRGLTTEALVALIELAASDIRVTCVVADTTVDNPGSRRVLEKAGFALDRTEGAQVFYLLEFGNT
jgi:RimJ/RimL family protein N-acetyltransferase